MNAIILSAVLGVVMMLCSFLVKERNSIRHIASVFLLILLVSNIADTYGTTFFIINTYGMLSFDRFGYLFNSIAIGSTLIYVLITGKEIERCGKYVAEYFTLIFFVLCGITLLSSYNNLLTLFLGIEIMSIPLYILTGSDKRNMKSNEAALKYFLMGSFSTGLMLMGIALTYGATGSFGLEVVHTHTQQGANGISETTLSFLEVMGMLLLMVSIGFKVSAAPFHFWTPD